MPARRLRQLHRPWGAGLRAFAATTLVAVALTAGCGGDDDNGLPPPNPGGTASPPPSPAVTLTAQEQEAVDEVRELFDEFMTAYVDLATSGDAPDDEAMAPILQRIDGSLYNEVNLELVNNYLAGIRMADRLLWVFVDVVEVALAVDNEQRQPAVHLRYCIDATDWQTVDKGTEQPKTDAEPVFPSGVHVGSVRASYFDPYSHDDEDPQWYLAAWSVDEAVGAC